MKNWFKKSDKVQELIQEIHNTFETEVDNLLEFSKQISPVTTDKQHLIDKHNRLSRLGFINTNEGNVAKKEVNRLHQVKVENKQKEKLYNAISYFSFTYPQYKFITEDSVNEICEKYGLVFGDVTYYIGDVPDKNLEQMEKFKIKEEDECWEYVQDTMYSRKISFHSKEKCFQEQENHVTGFRGGYDIGYVNKSNLKIVASVKDFDTSRMELNGHELKQIPDPIVLQPVVYEDERFFLVVTAWGLEAEDVVNEKLN